MSNAEEFGDWLGVALQGKSYKAREQVRGHVTHSSYEHVIFNVLIERMDPDTLLSWRWHPAGVDPAVDYTHGPTTLVVFELQKAPNGTLLSVSESGFDKVPTARRVEAFRLNSGGWDGQMDNIEKHFDAP